MLSSGGYLREGSLTKVFHKGRSILDSKKLKFRSAESVFLASSPVF